uniref:Phosphoribosyltransferase domain-containing protein n=1 Tax=viral metagenome TaxID=1070528 RepID=A0A6C0JA59_9ZZZZ
MVSVSYGTEYSKSELYVLDDVIMSWDRVLIIDDLVATGGSIAAAATLIEKFNASIVGALTAIQLKEFSDSQVRKDIKVYSLYQAETDGKLTST